MYCVSRRHVDGAPHVAGLAALLRARNPSLSTAELKTAILDQRGRPRARWPAAVTGARANADTRPPRRTADTDPRRPSSTRWTTPADARPASTPTGPTPHADVDPTLQRQCPRHDARAAPDADRDGNRRARRRAARTTDGNGRPLLDGCPMTVTPRRRPRPLSPGTPTATAATTRRRLPAEGAARSTAARCRRSRPCRRSHGSAAPSAARPRCVPAGRDRADHGPAQEGQEHAAAGSCAPARRSTALPNDRQGEVRRSPRPLPRRRRALQRRRRRADKTKAFRVR